MLHEIKVYTLPQLDIGQWELREMEEEKGKEGKGKKEEGEIRLKPNI